VKPVSQTGLGTCVAVRTRFRKLGCALTFTFGDVLLRPVHLILNSLDSEFAVVFGGDSPTSKGGGWWPDRDRSLTMWTAMMF